LGGRVYLVPILPGDAVRHLGGDTPAFVVCLQSVGYPSKVPDAGGCTTAERMQSRSLTGYSDVPSYPVVQAALRGSHVPERLWGGKVVSGIVPDGVVSLELHYWDGAFRRVPVHDNVVLYHTNRNIDYYRVYWRGPDGHFIGPASTTIRDEAVSPPPDLTPTRAALGLPPVGARRQTPSHARTQTPSAPTLPGNPF
jgi:hypothetical protein